MHAVFLPEELPVVFDDSGKILYMSYSDREFWLAPDSQVEQQVLVDVAQQKRVGVRERVGQKLDRHQSVNVDMRGFELKKKQQI